MSRSKSEPTIKIGAASIADARPWRLRASITAWLDPALSHASFLIEIEHQE